MPAALQIKKVNTVDGSLSRHYRSPEFESCASGLKLGTITTFAVVSDVGSSEDLLTVWTAENEAGDRCHTSL